MSLVGLADGGWVMTDIPTAHGARSVITWCRRGYDALVIDPGPAWIVLWAGTLALLRSVGHVLEKDPDPFIKRAQDAWWRKLKATKPEPMIFWAFIHEDRNSLLKEAEITAQQNVTVDGAVITVRGPLGAAMCEEARPPHAVYTFPMTVAPYEGRASREVIKEAIE
jgi:hypothetical protein